MHFLSDRKPFQYVLYIFILHPPPLYTMKKRKQSWLRPFVKMALKEPTLRQIKIMRIFLSRRIQKISLALLKFNFFLLCLLVPRFSRDNEQDCTPPHCKDLFCAINSAFQSEDISDNNFDCYRPLSLSLPLSPTLTTCAVCFEAFFKNSS